MKIIKTTLTGDHGRSFSLDITLPKDDSKPHPLLVFAHGFKGFKDWGHWHRIAQQFADAGYAFLKFNFAFNGTTTAAPFDFADLEAFGQNNFSKEFSDVRTVLDWLSLEASYMNINLNDLTMIGHSRGGPIALLSAVRDNRIKKLITWASVHELDYAWQNQDQLEKWKKEGVLYATNARTGQQMPMYYQLYEDFLENAAVFSIKNALQSFKKPMLIVHGDADPAVKTASAEYLKKYAPHARLCIIEGADHVFGGKHPFPEEEDPPAHTTALVNACLDFLQAN